MKALQFKDSTGPTLVCAEVPKPEPSADEVLIHVRAAGVTPTELLWYTTTHNKDGAARTRAIPTHEFSGVIAALGKNVRGLNIGAEVYGMNDWFADGAAAEYCLAVPQNLSAKPTTLTHQAAATVPIAALTAWQGLLDHARIQATDRILVHGGAGAVGLFVVQLARLHGAHVIATVSGRDMDFAKQLGANEAIDYTTTRFEEVVQNVDVIFDTVGGETLNRSWSVLKASGRGVTIAAESEGAADQRVKDAFFIVEPNQSQLTEVAELIDAGRLKTFIKAVVPLNEAATAYHRSPESRSGPGKIVIAVSA